MLSTSLSEQLRVGVLGAGHLGKIHLRCLGELPEQYHLVGFFDPNPELSAQVAAESGLHRFESIADLIEAVDVVDIVTPTLSHYDCAVQALERGRHIFIEKPVTHTLEEARDLLRRIENTPLKVQVGHVERFNPAYVEARKSILKPRFIEIHRLAEFNPRGTDVPVVLDLMIHDIDIVLDAVQSELVDVRANGVAVVSSSPDIATARLEFANGAVANLTASRISLKNMRKARFFQQDAYITVDFLKKETEFVRMKDAPAEPDPFAMVLELGDGQKRQIEFERPSLVQTNAIRDELRTLSEAINNDTAPIVSLKDGYRALEVAQNILSEVERNTAIRA
ncbi:gfo/Idh/MocA family oxidoreductase [bacterium]|nr:gfo/Idh/MocA family oxidoreductase [bacterium]